MKSNKKLNIIIIVLIIVIVLVYKNNEKLESSMLKNEEYLITDKSELDEYINNGKLKIISVGEETCIACKDLSISLEKVKGKYNDIDIRFIEYSKFDGIEKIYELKVVPTMFFYDSNGELYYRKEGVLTKDEIIKIIKDNGKCSTVC